MCTWLTVKGNYKECGAGHSLVSEIIDFEQTEEGMMVVYGVCDQLDELKHTYHGLPDFLTKVRHAS